MKNLISFVVYNISYVILMKALDMNYSGASAGFGGIRKIEITKTPLVRFSIGAIIFFLILIIYYLIGFLYQKGKWN